MSFFKDKNSIFTGLCMPVEYSLKKHGRLIFFGDKSSVAFLLISGPYAVR